MIRTLATTVMRNGPQCMSQMLMKSSARFLYTPSSLGLDGYILQRERTKAQFASTADKFREKMTEFTTDDANQMVFSEDLKNMVHLADQSGKDTELVVKMLKKFASQNKELRFGNYVFGPVVMRMFHHVGDADAALECFKDKDMQGFFDQWASYNILLDMLYDKGRYQDVLDAYDIIKGHRQEGGAFPKQALVIVMAACYKMNTPASYEYAMQLWKDMVSGGHIPMRRTSTFAAALALTQNAPHVALEILYSTKQQNYITVRNLKVVAMLDLGRLDDVLPILRSVLESRDGMLSKQTFCSEVIERVRDLVSKSDNKELQLDYERIEKFLKEHGHISNNKLDDVLCSQIDTKQFVQGQNINKSRAVLNASFARDGNRQNYDGGRQNNYDNRNRRAGLKEMY